MHNLAKRRHQGFSPEARIKAIATKQARAEEAPPPGEPAVFVVRAGNGYGWEVRRYGAIVVGRGDAVHPTAGPARTAGEATLARPAP